MAHFAKLDENNIVLEIHVVHNDEAPIEEVGVMFLKNWSGGYENWKQTSYNGKFRKNFAGVGYRYDPVLDAFIPPQPFSSWVLDEETCQWSPPIPYPLDNKQHFWDESTRSWKELLIGK